MSVSMLLNAANVVTAAERCHAIDEKTGRIPINFLLSRSTDLDDSVKDQLQQLAVTSPSISTRRDRPVPPLLPTAAEEEALKDIDRETAHRGNLIRRPQRRNQAQTLTRKAIRKHTGTNKLASNGKKGGGVDSSSTRETTASSGVQSSVNSSASQQSNMPRRRWKEWEDELLVQVVAEHGPTRWNNLAKHFPGRNGRQVRLRWMNHLQPSLDKRPWRPEEDAVLLEAHKALGNKWALISMRLCGRTDNSVKNRYKSIARRAAREAKASRK